LFDDEEVQRTPLTKEGVRAKVDELVKGMVLLKVEDEGAWVTMLEWTDVDTLGKWHAPAFPPLVLILPCRGIQP
jgi:hypothetical protein